MGVVCEAPSAPRKAPREESPAIVALLARVDACVTDSQRQAVWEAANDNEWGMRLAAEPNKMSQTAAVLLDRDTVEAAELLDELVAAHLVRDKHWGDLLVWAVMFTDGGKRPNRAKARHLVEHTAHHATSKDIAALVSIMHEELETHEFDAFRELGIPRTHRTLLAARRGLAQWQAFVGLPHDLIELDDDDADARMGLGVADYAEDADDDVDEAHSGSTIDVESI